jgi:hypothetical protein
MTFVDEPTLEAADGEQRRKASCARTANEKEMKHEKRVTPCIEDDTAIFTSGYTAAYPLEKQRKVLQLRRQQAFCRSCAIN